MGVDPPARRAGLIAMRLQRHRGAAGLGLVALAALALAACSPAGAGPLRGEAVRTVEITIHYSHFSPSQVTARAGTSVRFVITNTDPIDHEFILGDQAVQDREESGTDTVHDGSVPGMVSVPAGTTAATVVSFPRSPAGGALIYACHLPGHYAYGMRGVVQVTP